MPMTPAERKHNLRLIRRSIEQRSAYLAFGMAVARFLTLLGVILLTMWSYSVWGSDTSPLALLLWPAIAILLVSLLLRSILHWVRRWIVRASLLERRRLVLRDRIRMSQAAIRKL